MERTDREKSAADMVVLEIETNERVSLPKRQRKQDNSGYSSEKEEMEEGRNTDRPRKSVDPADRLTSAAWMLVLEDESRDRVTPAAQGRARACQQVQGSDK